MLKKVRKDKKLRTKFCRQEQNRIILKSLTENNNFAKIVKWNSGFNLVHASFSSKNKLVNRCVFSGRNNKIHYYYRFSRLSFLNFVRNTMVPGLFKAS